MVSGTEHMHLPHLPAGQPSFTVAAARNLHDGVQRSHRAPHDREVHVDPGLDKLRGDDAARLTFAKPLTDFTNEAKSMIGAHGGREMNRFLALGQAALQFIPQCGSVASEVYDAED